jgi:hypothetical protein
MVIGTTFVAPPFLKWAFARFGSTTSDEARPPVSQSPPL